MNNFMSSNNSRPEEMQLKSTSLSREHSAKIGINEDLWCSRLLLSPIYMVWGTRDNPPPKTTLPRVYVKFNICWPSFGQVTYLTKGRTTGRKYRKNPGHGLCTHFLFELSRLGSARQGVYMWKSCPASPPPPPPVFSCTWDEFVTSCKRLAEFFKRNKWKVSSLRVTWGGGLSVVPETM